METFGREQHEQRDEAFRPHQGVFISKTTDLSSLTPEREIGDFLPFSQFITIYCFWRRGGTQWSNPTIDEGHNETRRSCSEQRRLTLWWHPEQQRRDAKDGHEPGGGVQLKDLIPSSIPPTLIYELNLGDCFLQEQGKRTLACLSKAQCHKPQFAIHVKVKWSRKTNRCARSKPSVRWAVSLE